MAIRAAASRPPATAIRAAASRLPATAIRAAASRPPAMAIRAALSRLPATAMRAAASHASSHGHVSGGQRLQPWPCCGQPRPWPRGSPRGLQPRPRTGTQRRGRAFRPGRRRRPGRPSFRGGPRTWRRPAKRQCGRGLHPRGGRSGSGATERRGRKRRHPALPRRSAQAGSALANGRSHPGRELDGRRRGGFRQQRRRRPALPGRREHRAREGDPGDWARVAKITPDGKRLLNSDGRGRGPHTRSWHDIHHRPAKEGACAAQGRGCQAR